MEIGGDETDSALQHSKFHKARRELLRSKSSSSTASSKADEDAPGPSAGEILVATSGLGVDQQPSVSPSSSSSTSSSTLEGSANTTAPATPAAAAAVYQFQQEHPIAFSGAVELLPIAAGSTIAFAPSPILGTNETASAGVIVSNPLHSPYLRQQSCPEASTSSSITHLAATTSREAHSESSVPAAHPSEVFRFDSTDRERYLCAAISEEEEVFAHETSLFTQQESQSFDSPHIVLDSPTNSPLSGSQLQLAEELSMLGAGNTSLLTPHAHMEGQSRVMARLAMAMLPTTTVESGSYGGIPASPISPLTPNTPLSPSPLFASDQMLQQGFLAELYRRRCHSDSDLPFLPDAQASHPEPTDLTVKQQVVKTHTVRPRKPIPHPLTIPSKGGSLESDQSSQDSPLDLSVRGSRERFASSSCDSLTTRFLSSLVSSAQPHSPGVALIRGDVASPTTRNSVALRYNLDVSPVVEEMPPGADMAFVCPVCGQMFSLHDRLAKHMASRHKSKPHDPNKNYPCDVCHRSFARSDMLTRHMRLHTGVKPYTCRTCGQVFSRSDHLSTHQRTHTGEKPYKCPQCCYSACRRDMITRHLRTHTRGSSSSSSDVTSTTSTPTSTTFSASDSFPSFDELRPIKLEPISAIPMHSRPPSSLSSFAPDCDSPTPGSPALNIGGLSVQSPPAFLQKDVAMKDVPMQQDVVMKEIKTEMDAPK